MEVTFKDIKEAMTKATMLTCPLPNVLVSLYADVSEVAQEAILYQHVKGQWGPLILSRPKIKYSTFDQELLPIYLAIWHHHFYLEG